MPGSTTLDDLLTSPDHLLFALEGDQALFVTMDRDAYRRSVFLDARISPVHANILKVPVAALAGKIPASAPGPGWIFHVAHCGSTLLARALERPSGDLVLREPMALRQLGVSGHDDTPTFDERLDLAVGMLGKRYHRDAPAIVKANVPVNFIIPALMARRPHAPAILLYFPFERYLQAILRGPNHRKWVMSVTTELSVALTGRVGDIGGLDEVERAAALWLAQMRIFSETLAASPNVRSLDAEILFNQPGEVIAAAADLFGVAMPADDIDAVVASDLFATYSKDARMPFDNRDRLARRASLAALLAPDIARARRWLDGRMQQLPLGAALAAPLLGESPKLL